MDEFLNTRLKHMESAIVPGIYDSSLADEDLRIGTERAYRMVRRLAREEGVFVGPSAAANIVAALQVAREASAPATVESLPSGFSLYSVCRVGLIPIPRGSHARFPLGPQFMAVARLY